MTSSIDPKSAEQQAVRYLFRRRDTFNVGAGGPEVNLLSLPPATCIDVYVQYRQPGQSATILSPAGGEIFSLYANEELFSRKLAEFRPADGAGVVHPLPPIGRIFAIRDVPVVGWELKINTQFVFAPFPPSMPNGVLTLDVMVIGWAREPTAIGPFEMQTLAAGEVFDSTSLSFAPTGGLDRPGPPAQSLVPVLNQLQQWTPSANDLAGAFDVIMCGVGPSGSIVPVQVDPVTGATSLPVVLQNYTTALSHFFVPFPSPFDAAPAAGTTISPIGASGRIDASAPTSAYYVQCWNFSGEPPAAQPVTPPPFGGGAIMAPLKIQHVFGVDDYWNIDFSGQGQLRSMVGWTITLSSTEFTYTAAGNYMTTTAFFYQRSP